MANTHGELSELWEAHRKGQLHAPCDKTPTLSCLEEEMADIIIRTLDACGRLGRDASQQNDLVMSWEQKRINNLL